MTPVALRWSIVLLSVFPMNSTPGSARLSRHFFDQLVPICNASLGVWYQTYVPVPPVVFPFRSAFSPVCPDDVLRCPLEVSAEFMSPKGPFDHLAVLVPSRSIVLLDLFILRLFALKWSLPALFGRRRRINSRIAGRRWKSLVSSG